MADDAAADDLESMVTNQRLELLAASAADSDLTLAFRLQMEEAIAASLSSAPSSSDAPSPPPPPPPVGDDGDLADLIAIQSLELDRFHQETQDADRCRAEHRRITADLLRRAHDHRFAREVHDMPEADWEDFGDEFERPIEVGDEKDLPFHLYFKGMASREHPPAGGPVGVMSAIGVAVCDPLDNLLLKIQKALPGTEASREILEAKGLIEGLNAAASLGIKCVHVFCDYKVLYNHVTGKWRVKQRKLSHLIEQVWLLQRKFESCKMFLLPRCHVKFVFKLARDAIDSQITRNVNLDGHEKLMETCNICLEVIDSSQMFTVDVCLHKFCFSCMKQHVEVKLLHGVLPACPHVGCNIRLTVESARKFLSPKLLEVMSQRIKEASIPATEKVYCPYPKCSALMSRSEAIRPQHDSSSTQFITDTSGLRKCIKCSGSFCINCKVPWHDRMSCDNYKILHPHARAEDVKLKSLATQKLWQQCAKCSHMIELIEGCFHMTCRCGYEFCYTCGAEWKDKKATCSCPLWDEGYILNDDIDEDSDFDDDDDDWDGEEEDDDDYDYDFLPIY